MTSVTRATTGDIQLLAAIGRKSFIESHGHSATPEVINNYVNEKFNSHVVTKELDDTDNIYYFIFHNDQPAGYSKIILNAKHPAIAQANTTKLERLYLLKEFYSLQLGLKLFEFNVNLSKENKQEGMWLFVWKENHRAINFYKKHGFKIIGSYDFKLTETHSNPNYLMLLRY